MMIDDMLARLQAVRRSGHGWMAQCPAHDDPHPSLSIAIGDKGILLHCFAGCAVDEVTTALGLALADLFYDSRCSPTQRTAMLSTYRSFDWRQFVSELEDEVVCLWLRGTTILESAAGLEISTWTDEEIDEAFERISTAHLELARAEALESLAFKIRAGILQKERKNPSRSATA